MIFNTAENETGIAGDKEKPAHTYCILCLLLTAPSTYTGNKHDQLLVQHSATGISMVISHLVISALPALQKLSVKNAATDINSHLRYKKVVKVFSKR